MGRIYTAPKFEHLPEAMREAICESDYLNMPLSAVALAKNVTLDIAKCPHVLVAGSTGSGKSVLLHTMICSLLLRNTPATANLLLIDPKRVELKPFYDGNPILACPVVTDIDYAIKALKAVQEEMQDRYAEMERRRIRKWDGQKLYVFVDEFAELVYRGKRAVQDLVANLAFLGRAAGIHIIIAVQHPSHDIISRNIIANFTTRICLLVDKWSESQLILGESGAEKLRGNGDALLKTGGKIRRFQGVYIDDDELDTFAHSWKVEEETETVVKIPLAEAEGFCF